MSHRLGDPRQLDRRTHDGERVWWPPSWVLVTALAATILGAISVTVVWYELSSAAAQQRGVCERTVERRDDARAMWVELFKAFPEAAEESGLIETLEVRLPPLRCDGSNVIQEETP